MFTLCRVLTPDVRPRHGIISEFVLMFVAGVTPGQLGAPLAQVAVLVRAGMRVAEVATAELLTGFCTVLFFMLTAVGLMVLRARGLLVVEGAAQLDWLVGFSAVVFGAVLAVMILGAAFPAVLRGLVRGGASLFGPAWHGAIRRLAARPRLAALRSWPGAGEGYLSARLLASLDHVHRGFVIYARRGKLAVLAAFVLTFGFFCARFAVAYFILLGLGVSTEPRVFVAVGPPIVQVILAQALLNFALYLSPTPGASGIAEAGSTAIMSPWVYGAHELPYLVLWRGLALFLCMFVGGTYVFRYLGTDVLEAEARRAGAAPPELEEPL
jgi:uncharacterized membrane protein YbhN (UPF0104 family)